MTPEQISPELVERCVALVRSMGGLSSVGQPYGDDYAIRYSSLHYSTARAIVAELPKPVDPDLILAREVVCEYHHDKHPESPWHANQAERVRAGHLDNMLDVQAAYHGIRRGRELALAARS